MNYHIGPDEYERLDPDLQAIHDATSWEDAKPLILHAHQESRSRVRGTYRRLLVAFVVLAVGLGVAWGVSTGNNRNRINDIQQSRFDACNDANARNRGTLLAFDQLSLERLAKLPPGSARALPTAEVERRLVVAVAKLPKENRTLFATQRAATEFLIGRIVPKRSCKRVVGR